MAAVCEEEKPKKKYYLIYILSLALGLYTVSSNVYWVIPLCLAGGGFLLIRSLGEAADFSENRKPYIFLKTGSGKQIDYAMRNPEDIRKIDAYALPSDDDLIRQEVDQMICETCLFRDHCNGVFCLRNPEERAALQKQLFDAIKGNHG